MSTATGMIQTVCGPITPDDLGPTLLHEHVLCDIRPPDWKALEQVGAHVTRLKPQIWQKTAEIRYFRFSKTLGVWGLMNAVWSPEMAVFRGLRRAVLI